MSKKKKKRQQQHEPDILCVPSLYTATRESGEYIPLSKPLVKFMGKNNALFLNGIVDHYNYLRRCRKVEEGILFYSGPILKRNWDVSKYHQKKAIKELSACGLLKEVGLTRYNRRRLRISNVGCFVFIEMIGDPRLKIYLSSLFNIILGDKRFQRLIQRKIKQMEIKWEGRKFNRNDFEYPPFIKRGCKRFNNFIVEYLMTKLE